MNPIEILYTWQALLVAIAAAGLTQLIKTVYDVYRGQQEKKRISTPPSPPAEEKASYREPPKQVKTTQLGKEVRKSNPWLNRVLLPMIPIILGGLIAVLVPMRPEALVEYVEAHANGWVEQSSVYAMWGAACGQFADYVFSKAKAMFQAFVDSRSGGGASG